MPSACLADPQTPQFRADIQALRAIAVSAVVTFHLWPSALSGGYVGVDVFFVISGFLIGSQLIREIEGTGGIDLLGFWARRIRRLQPAALLVLSFTLTCTLLWVPRSLWIGWLQEIAASALWVQNWLLASNAVDYLAASNEPAPTQHYWTLSIEEQFYLGIPLLLAAFAWLAAKRRVAPSRYIFACLSAIVLLSFLLSLWQTHSSPSTAYFSTFTRAWEFAIGALLAATRSTANRETSNPAVMLGVALVIASSRIYGRDTPFPGLAALGPVAGTLLCIWAGRNSMLDAFGRLRPIAFLGRSSYAIYLWHWPLIVLAPWALLNTPLDLVSPHLGERAQELLIAASSLVLGWLSTRYVESRFRVSSNFPSTDRRNRFVAIGFIAGVMLLLSALASPLQGERSRQKSLVQDLVRIRALPIDELPSCFGAAAMDKANKGCRNPRLEGVLLPDPSRAREDDPVRPECWNTIDGAFHICAFGPKSSYTLRILAVGDSHNIALLDAYEYIAAKNNWRIDVSGFGGCYMSTAVPASGTTRACANWRQFISREASKHRYDAYLFTHARSNSPISPAPGKTRKQTTIDGLVDAWRALPAAPILALADNPGTGRGSQIASCYVREAMRSGDIRSACSWTRSRALPEDGLREAVALVENAQVIDLTQYYCDETMCPAVIGNVLVYRDDNHVTRTWTRTLAPYLNQEIRAALEQAHVMGASR